MMLCPCCLGALTRPPKFLDTREGDRYCPLCEWLLGVELLHHADPPADVADVLTCPRHGPQTQWGMRRQPTG
jgi:hypothetical protein